MLDLLPVYSLTVLSCDLLPGTRVAPRGCGGAGVGGGVPLLSNVSNDITYHSKWLCKLLTGIVENTFYTCMDIQGSTRSASI